MAVIEVYADVCCPFTHVGLRRLVALRQRAGRDDVRLRIRAWPLELVNGRPLDPAFIAEEVDELREQVASDLFAGFDESAFPATSIPAMALAARAYEISDSLGERVSLALRDALFERGLDISDRDVLTSVAAGADVPAEVVDAGRDDGDEGDDALVRRSWDRGRAQGVIGSPHFFLVEHDYFCPALHIERVDGRLHIEVSDDAFERFAAEAFADDGGEAGQRGASV